MNTRHAAALALGCVLLTGCWTAKAGPTADDPCRATIPGGGRVHECEELRATSARNALLQDYRKCADANASDPTRCSAILQGLNAYGVNFGSNQPQQAK